MHKIRKELETELRRINPTTRGELDVMLADLNAAMPLLVAQNPDSVDFMPLLADRVDKIAHQASPVDYEWLMDGVDDILQRHGKQDNEYLLPQNLLTL